MAWPGRTLRTVGLMPIRLYDTMARKKVDFEPINRERVTMYVCGPTVYGRAHIGNARPAVVFDILARLLRHEYGADSLVYARNVTDIDDKIIAAAQAEGVATEVIAKRFEDHYLADMGALGVAPPTLAPHATAHIAGMVAMIGDLIAKGAAYAAEGHVLFDVTADAGYGRLSRRPLAEMIAGARVEVAPYKRNPADFVLWKPSADAQPGWDSPWGRGRPGWHIECSAMIAAELGPNAEHPNPTIDIHGGGLDLIFPHHENELAQSACAHGGAPLAQVWMHNGFLSMGGGEKMSKSLGNVATVGELIENGHPGEALRLALLSAHYRQPLQWSDDLIGESRRTLNRWYRFLAGRNAQPTEPSPAVIAALNDDLNIPAARAEMAKLVAIGDAGALIASARLIGLLNYDPDFWLKMEGGSETAYLIPDFINEEQPDDWLGSKAIQSHIDARATARSRRDFGEADRIRDYLEGINIILEDGPGGTTWRRA